MSQKVAEDLNLSSAVVVDDLLRDLRVKNKGIYLSLSVKCAWKRDRKRLGAYVASNRAGRIT